MLKVNKLRIKFVSILCVFAHITHIQDETTFRTLKEHVSKRLTHQRKPSDEVSVYERHHHQVSHEKFHSNCYLEKTCRACETMCYMNFSSSSHT